MSWTDLVQRLKRGVFPPRSAILRGAGEVENVGDIMMRDTARKLIASLGFDRVYTVGHGDNPADLSSVAGAIDAIFVLGSLQYSDAWASPTLAARLERAIAFHRCFPRARVIFLPSTWGAFESQHKDALLRLVAGAHVLVRDRFSVDAINGLLGSSVAEYCPDLAFIYPTAGAADARSLLERTAEDPIRPLMGIVPNQRCVEQGVTPLQHPEEYVAFLARARDFAAARGFTVVGISHMLNTDRDLCLIRELGIACVPADNVTLIRSIIANLTVCICSRYHGLISCLSHGTPVLALGWHHKYRNLMDDMGLGAYHLSVAQLPRDPAPLLDDLFVNHENVRHAITHSVATARRVVRTKIEALPRLSGGA
jgi:polysaccharide pyruvyl transferase WcaK-like protein